MTTTAAPAATGAVENTVSNWAAPYVGSMLSAAQNIAAQPYQVYGGQQIADPSQLQNSAWSGIAGLTNPNAATTGATNALTSNVGSYGTQGLGPAGSVQSYMNPYTQAAIDPQLALATKNAQIQEQGVNAGFAQAGAFGGSRQGVQNANDLQNLNMNLQNIEATGLNTAYNTAQQTQLGVNQQNLGYLTGQTGAAQSLGNLGLNTQALGLSANQQMANQGQTQYNIAQAQDTSNYQNFLNQANWPKTQLAFQQSMLQGLPIGTQNTYGVLPSTTSQVMSGVGSGATLGNQLFGTGTNSAAAPAATSPTSPTSTSGGLANLSQPLTSSSTGTGIAGLQGP